MTPTTSAMTDSSPAEVAADQQLLVEGTETGTWLLAAL